MSAIGSARLKDVEAFTRPVKPGERRVVHGWYWCSYWQFAYVVKAMGDGNRVEVHTPADDRTWSHFTPLHKNDRVFITE